MKRIILILLCLPLFIFSQEEREYDRTMSVSQFAEELKQAGDKGNDYTLEDCEIVATISNISDILFLHTETIDGGFRSFNMVFDSIYFPEESKVKLSNCTFRFSDYNRSAASTSIKFKDCQFGEFIFSDIEKKLIIDSITCNNLTISKCSGFEIKNSTITSLKILSNWDGAKGASSSSYNEIENNAITHLSIRDLSMVSIEKNTISYLSISGNMGNLWVRDNVFDVSFKNLFQISQYGRHSFRIEIVNGLNSNNVDIDYLMFAGNTSRNITNTITTDSIIKVIERYGRLNHVRKHVYSSEYLDWKFNEIPNQEYSEKDKDNFMIPLKQLQILQGLNKSNDSLEFTYIKSPLINIWECSIKELRMFGNLFGRIHISGNEIFKDLIIKKTIADSLFEFYKNSIPASNRIEIDENIFKNLGFNIKTKLFYGNEDYKKVKSHLNDKNYSSSIKQLITQYRQFIKVLDQNGSIDKDIGVIKLKDIQTYQKMYEYYEDPNMNAWFNWKGGQFLKWYSDYGMNPFKALAYCFWAMLYFALFYFFFYSDWDKIDRGFLIKRFNSVMDYFTTEKRIQDFYSSTHDKEMTSFTDFKNTLDKNKVHMPSMLASLAKPIYQISLLRYRLLNFSYKKAEFMAGRKWVDLKKKDRYWIGTLTFFLTLTYIIYLIFIRALNSIALSVNAFSTLGFGQIPVKGFTKYIAIIEGFIGWFMLSVFIVSLLSQMMSV